MAIVFVVSAKAQTTAPNEWTWVGGSNSFNQVGVYGTLGAPDAANIPGSRSGSTTWVDGNGDLWLFGGFGVSPGSQTQVPLYDLWEFDPRTNEWTWVGSAGSPAYGTLGVPAAGNSPTARSGAMGQIDGHGNLWLVGGFGVDSNGAQGALNDIWRFEPSTSEWTWMGGSDLKGQSGTYGSLGTPAASNIPGARTSVASWVDSTGQFWLFGGVNYDTNFNSLYLNDLWKFDSTSNQWAWMGGSQANGTTGTPGVYGTLGIASTSNCPGGRLSPGTWADSAGRFWLFGGYGIDSAGTVGYLSDLWMFDPASGQWTWEGGSSTITSQATYGTVGVQANTNLPGGRSAAASWTDLDGHFWLFGGDGNDANGAAGDLNDLWTLDPALNKWTWIGGSNTVGANGSYGTLGVPALSDIPGARSVSAAWTGASGVFWLWSGYLSLPNNQFSLYSDFWAYQPSALSSTATPVFSPGTGTYTSVQSVTMSDTTPGATIYYTTDGTTPTSSSNLYIGPIPVVATETINAIAVASGYSTSAVASAIYTINLPAAATPTFNVAGGTYTSVQSVTISDSMSGATIYYTTDGSTPTISSTAYSGPITVAVSETISAIAVASGYSSSAVASATYTINLPPASFALAATPTTLSVSSGGAGKTTLTVTPQNGFNAAVSFACSGLPTGATCAFSPATVTPSGSAATTTLTITAPAQTAAVRPGMTLGFPLATMALCVGWFGFRRPRGVALWIALLAIGAAGGLAMGCGGGGSGGGGSGGGTGSGPVTSTVTVTATSGSLQQTATLSLTVN